MGVLETPAVKECAVVKDLGHDRIYYNGQIWVPKDSLVTPSPEPLPTPTTPWVPESATNYGEFGLTVGGWEIGEYTARYDKQRPFVQIRIDDDGSYETIYFSVGTDLCGECVGGSLADLQAMFESTSLGDTVWIETNRCGGLILLQVTGETGARQTFSCQVSGN